MSLETTGRKIHELRACDLKDELAKRKLNSSGLKNELIERLQNALKDEGKDPEKFYFPALDKRGTKIPKKTEDVDSQILEEKNSSMENENKKESLVVDEVGTVDGDENDFQEQVDASTENANDNEESINLTIGEEEQQLLHDEEEQEDKENRKDNLKVTIKTENLTEDETEKENVDNVESSSCKEGINEVNDEKTVEKNSEKKTESDAKTPKSKEEKEKAAETKSAENKTNASSLSTTKSHRNLWVSGLTSITRASDLKSIFSKYGKVIGAKVVTNTRTPGSRCYGYVTMGSSSEATRCIEHLHGSELHGRIISVERTKNEIGNNKTSHPRKEEDKRRHSSKDSKRKTSESGTPSKTIDDKDNKDNKDNKEVKAKEGEKESTEKDKEASKELKEKKLSISENNVKKPEDKSKVQSRSIKSSSRTSLERKKSRDRRMAEERERERRARERREREILTFKKIREERERQKRLREKERELREEERRRRDIRRRQREEEDRLAREREKLAMERERLEREKAELMRLERERQKLEREKIELERLELKRQQMKIMEQSSRIEEKRPVKRATDDRYPEVDRKRPANDRRFEAPPPPRFDSSLATNSYDRTDKKREDYVSSSKRDDYASKRDDYISSKRDDYSKRDEFPSKRSSDIIVPPPPPRHSSGYHSSHANRENATHKSSRYIESEGRPAGYRSGRSPERSDIRVSSKRYEVSSSYSERPSSSVNAISNSAPWHAGSNQTIKSFASSSMPTSSGVSVWQNKSTEDHWGRPIDAQDRYDRTYNERGGYGLESSRSTAMFGGRPDGRYSGQISSRYENGKY